MAFTVVNALLVLVGTLLVARIYRAIACPSNLKHLPAVPMWTWLKLALQNKPTDLRAKLLADAANEEGLGRFYFNGLWSLVVTNPEIGRSILADTDTFPKWNQGDVNPGALAPTLFGKNIINTNGSEWKRHRRIIAPAFHSFNPYVDVFAHATNDLSTTIRDFGAGKTVNVSDAYSKMTIDVICQAGFNYHLQSLKSGNTRWLEAYRTFFKNLLSPLYFIFPKLEKLNIGGRSDKITASSHVLDEMFFEAIEKRREQINQAKKAQEDELEAESSKPPNDLLALMVRACDHAAAEDGEIKSGLTPQELRNNLLIFFIAGHETTSNALSSISYYLAVNPDIQDRAREECEQIMEGKPKNATATYDEQKRMVYLSAVMKEALRLNSPVTQLGPRIVKKPEGVQLGSCHLPYGSLIIVSTYAMHHDAKSWPNPEKFDPTRYLVEDEGIGLKEKSLTGRERLAWTPFGSGPRACIGLNFSLIEQRIVLSHLLRQFTFRLPEDSKHRNGIVNCKDTLVSPDNMTIIFEPRV